MAAEKSIQFLRTRDYQLLQELGQGASGKTVLLRDDVLDELFVCKKYSPAHAEHQQELFANFLREIKLLHQVQHQNVVRVFNYYLYPNELTGYILMEYVKGTDIEEHLKSAPEQASEIFLQAIEGFQYLEANNILHRDIRPLNILVRDDGVLKIIDLGFGKKVITPGDFDKSISLNWWCEPPSEFATSTYDFRTEVYFVGKLFEKIVKDNDIHHFKYKQVVDRMCQYLPEARIQSFSEVQKIIKSDLFFDIDFGDQEREWYRAFADAVTASVTKIEAGTKYVDDVERIRTRLHAVLQACMLESEIPDSVAVLRCLLNGRYYYYTKKAFSVAALRDFLRLLRVSTHEKQRIVLANLHTRLDAINRYATPKEVDDDIPF